MNREEIQAYVAERMAGSQEAARHTHIECWCPDLEHRRDTYDGGCYCPACAAKAAAALGYPETDTEPEHEGPDDTPRWCDTCDRLITLRSTPDIEWGITADGALEELEHYETGLGFERGEPKTPDDWRVFMLLVDAIEEEHLPRVVAVIEQVEHAEAAGKAEQVRRRALVTLRRALRRHERRARATGRLAIATYLRDIRRDSAKPDHDIDDQAWLLEHAEKLRTSTPIDPTGAWLYERAAETVAKFKAALARSALPKGTR